MLSGLPPQADESQPGTHRRDGLPIRVQVRQLVERFYRCRASI
jgi:hypothetical protein